MSDGKKFGAKSLASAEQRLEDVEKNFDVIRERIQAYDAVLSEFQALKAELKSNRKAVESFISSAGSVLDELRSKIDTYSAQFQILHSKVDSNAKSLDDHKSYVAKFVSNTNKIVSDFNEVVSQIKNKMESLYEESKKIHDSIELQRSAISTLSSSQDSYKKSIDNLLTDHIKFKDATEASQAAAAKDQAKLAKAIASLPSLQEWANNLYGRVQQDAAYREKQATAYVDKKITELSKDFDSNPLSAQSIRNDLFNEIQALALDGKNAYLKSNNCATQLALLEKKLENLNLLIKKYELNR